MKRASVLFVPALLLTALALSGCSTLYFGTLEKLGYAKRDLLVKRVGAARDAQEDAKEQFASALERFSSVVKVDGGDLADKYDRLSSELARSESRAQAVRDRIDAVEDVSQALFAEWRDELKQYSNPSLRRASEQKMAQTQARYDQYIRAMHRAEEKMEPVLAAFRDQVLFLKHNLNAQAIASLEGELGTIEASTASLIRDMEASIAEANSFMAEMAEE